MYFIKSAAKVQKKSHIRKRTRVFLSNFALFYLESALDVCFDLFAKFVQAIEPAFPTQIT